MTEAKPDEAREAQRESRPAEPDAAHWATEEGLHRLIENMPAWMAYVGPDLRYRFVNKAYSDFFEKPREEIVGAHVSDVLGSARFERVKERMEAALAGQRSVFDAPLLRNGVESYQTVEYVPDTDGAGITHGFFIHVSDISERKRAEEALRRSESAFRKMLDSAIDGIVMSDERGRIVFANDSATRMFGYGADELVGQPIDALIPERFRVGHARLHAEYMAGRVPRSMGADRAVVARRRDGTEFPADIALSSMAGSDGPLVVAFIADTTERMAAQRRIEDYQNNYQKMLQKLAFQSTLVEERERQRIAKDLLDLLSQTLVVAQMKMRQARDLVADKPREMFKEALELVGQSFVTARTLMFELSPPILYELGVQAALSWLANETQRRHGIHVEFVDVDTKVALSEETSTILFRAVRELLMNVVKHARVKAARVVLAQANDHLEINVEDAGVGFDPLAHPPSRDGGFGLFGVSEQLNRLGGSLDIASTPGGGTRASLCVPLAPPEKDLLLD